MAPTTPNVLIKGWKPGVSRNGKDYGFCLALNPSGSFENFTKQKNVTKVGNMYSASKFKQWCVFQMLQCFFLIRFSSKLP